MDEVWVTEKQTKIQGNWSKSDLISSNYIYNIDKFEQDRSKFVLRSSQTGSDMDGWETRSTEEPDIRVRHWLGFVQNIDFRQNIMNGFTSHDQSFSYFAEDNRFDSNNFLEADFENDFMNEVPKPLIHITDSDDDILSNNAVEFRHLSRPSAVYRIASCLPADLLPASSEFNALRLSNPSPRPPQRKSVQASSSLSSYCSSNSLENTARETDSSILDDDGNDYDRTSLCNSGKYNNNFSNTNTNSIILLNHTFVVNEKSPASPTKSCSSIKEHPSPSNLLAFDLSSQQQKQNQQQKSSLQTVSQHHIKIEAPVYGTLLHDENPKNLVKSNSIPSKGIHIEKVIKHNSTTSFENANLSPVRESKQFPYHHFNSDSPSPSSNLSPPSKSLLPPPPSRLLPSPVVPSAPIPPLNILQCAFLVEETANLLLFLKVTCHEERIRILQNLGVKINPHKYCYLPPMSSVNHAPEFAALVSPPDTPERIPFSPGALPCEPLSLPNAALLPSAITPALYTAELPQKMHDLYYSMDPIVHLAMAAIVIRLALLRDLLELPIQRPSTPALDYFSKKQELEIEEQQRLQALNIANGKSRKRFRDRLKFSRKEKNENNAASHQQPASTATTTLQTPLHISFASPSQFAHSSSFTPHNNNHSTRTNASLSLVFPSGSVSPELLASSRRRDTNESLVKLFATSSDHDATSLGEENDFSDQFSSHQRNSSLVSHASPAACHAEEMNLPVSNQSLHQQTIASHPVEKLLSSFPPSVPLQSTHQQPLQTADDWLLDSIGHDTKTTSAPKLQQLRYASNSGLAHDLSDPQQPQVLPSSQQPQQQQQKQFSFRRTFRKLAGGFSNEATISSSNNNNNNNSNSNNNNSANKANELHTTTGYMRTLSIGSVSRSPEGSGMNRPSSNNEASAIDKAAGPANTNQFASSNSQVDSQSKSLSSVLAVNGPISLTALSSSSVDDVLAVDSDTESDIFQLQQQQQQSPLNTVRRAHFQIHDAHAEAHGGFASKSEFFRDHYYHQDATNLMLSQLQSVEQQKIDPYDRADVIREEELIRQWQVQTFAALKLRTEMTCFANSLVWIILRFKLNPLLAMIIAEMPSTLIYPGSDPRPPPPPTPATAITLKSKKIDVDKSPSSMLDFLPHLRNQPFSPPFIPSPLRLSPARYSTNKNSDKFLAINFDGISSIDNLSIFDHVGHFLPSQLSPSRSKVASPARSKIDGESNSYRFSRRNAQLCLITTPKSGYMQQSSLNLSSNLIAVENKPSLQSQQQQQQQQQLQPKLNFKQSLLPLPQKDSDMMHSGHCHTSNRRYSLPQMYLSPADALCVSPPSSKKSLLPSIEEYLTFQPVISQHTDSEFHTYQTHTEIKKNDDDNSIEKMLPPPQHLQNLKQQNYKDNETVNNFLNTTMAARDNHRDLSHIRRFTINTPLRIQNSSSPSAANYHAPPATTHHISSPTEKQVGFVALQGSLERDSFASWVVLDNKDLRNPLGVQPPSPISTEGKDDDWLEDRAEER